MLTQVLIKIASVIQSQVNNEQNLLLAIDGLDGAGKTLFADSLSEVLKSKGMEVVRASVDNFHNPKSVRYAKGRNSAEGFYEDSYNYNILINNLLIPFKSGDINMFYHTSCFNHQLDKESVTGPFPVRKGNVLLFDGIFLQRDELIYFWDLSIFLDVSRAESLKRCFERDRSGFQEVNHPANQRYVKGQELYFKQCNPQQNADIVVNNEDFNKPYIVRMSISNANL